MSVRKADRWLSDSFFRTSGDYVLDVTAVGDAQWRWTVGRLGSLEAKGSGTKLTEKKAKLAATRWLRRELRRAGR